MSMYGTSRVAVKTTVWDGSRPALRRHSQVMGPPMSLCQ